jgi:hypothetical protein
MRVNDICTLLIIRGLYREGHKTMTIRELHATINKLNYGSYQSELMAEKPLYFQQACKVKHAFRGMGRNVPLWGNSSFSDRFARAITRLARTGRIRVEGKKGRMGCYLNGSKIHLWDYTNAQLFGDDKLVAAVLGLGQ